MQNSSDVAQLETGVEIEQRNALGLISLDRPKALNAVDGAMVTAIADALPGFASDPVIYALVIRSSNTRAFCAGGDVRKIIAAYQENPETGKALFASEYALDWAMECFSKPTVALIDGAVMGSGVGLTAFITHRVAGENYRFAMPETMIGLFPDVGAAHVLARLPHEIGLYLGLTGRSIGRADAYALGLISHCISADHYDDIIAQLSEAWPVDDLLDERHENPGESELLRHALTISNCFSSPTLQGILDRLSGITGDEAEWAQEVRSDLEQRSPTSLAVSLRHIREAKSNDIREVLVRDYRLACSFLAGQDFSEGVRALLIDKDKSPKWQPGTIGELNNESIATYFLEPESGDLVLPEREVLQRTA